MSETIKNWLSLQHFTVDTMANMNKTTDSDLSGEMKTFYSDNLIDYAKPNLVHTQFGQEATIPKNGGKIIEFRKYDPFAKATTPLTEGVPPAGTKLVMGVISATILQFGDYVPLSDVLMVTAIDNNLVIATQNLGDQAGRTLDTLCRDVLVGGSNVQYAEDSVAARYLLEGGETSDNDYFTVDCVRRAVRDLKNAMAKPFEGGYYVAIINPDTAYDLMNDPAWQSVKDYDPTDWYNGELGRIAGCRFVETTESYVFAADDLCSTSRTLTINNAAGYVAATAAASNLTIDQTLTAGDQTAIVGRKIVYDGVQYTIDAAGANTISLSAVVAGSALTGGNYSTTINNVAGYAVGEAGTLITTAQVNAAFVGKKLYFTKIAYTVVAVGTLTITLDRPLEEALANGATLYSAGFTDDAILYPGEAGAKGRPVNATMVLGKNAYGIVKIDALSLEFITKQLGSAGTADPLNQQATAGWKASTITKRLTEAFMVRVETTSTFESVFV